MQTLLVQGWSKNERLGQIITLLQQLIILNAGNVVDVVVGEDLDPPSSAWIDDVAVIDAFQAKNIRRDRKKSRRKAKFEAWKNKPIDEFLDG